MMLREVDFLRKKGQHVRIGNMKLWLGGKEWIWGEKEERFRDRQRNWLQGRWTEGEEELEELTKKGREGREVEMRV